MSICCGDQGSVQRLTTTFFADHPPTADDFRNELNAMLYEASEGQAFVDINAGELHRRVGDYPGHGHQMQVCCDVMRRLMDEDAGDTIIRVPPSGRGATLNDPLRAASSCGVVTNVTAGLTSAHLR